MKNIAELLVTSHAVKTNFKEPFVWTSGIHSPVYCDCRELISIPDARDKIINEFLKLIERESLPTEIISGTATAGIPWAAFVADRLKVPMIYVRAKTKEHGVGKMVEGRGERGQKILVIEDALSTAGSSIQSAQTLKNELDAKVEHILPIFSWDTPAARENAKKAKLTLHALTNFHEIADALLETGKISSDEREELERFHTNPPGWWKG